MEILDNSNQETLPDLNPNETPQYLRSEMSPTLVLLLAAAFFIFGNILGSGLMVGLSKVYGLDFTLVFKNLSENSPVGTRNFMRLILLINHLFSFIIPAIATVWLAYRNGFFKYFKLEKKPKLETIVLGLVWLFVSMPLVQYVYQINKELHLPKWMNDLESDTGKLLETIIAKENAYEMVVTVLLIAVIPAIGEEMMFRGVIQQQLGRILKNEHITVWTSAFFFSAIHMQFQGFFARAILGALLGYLLIWSRNLWIPMIAHCFNNGIQIITLYVMDVKPSEMDKIGNTDKMHWTVAGISLLGVLAIGKYIREKNIEILPKEKEENYGL